MFKITKLITLLMCLSLSGGVVADADENKKSGKLKNAMKEIEGVYLMDWPGALGFPSDIFIATFDKNGLHKNQSFGVDLIPVDFTARDGAQTQGLYEVEQVTKSEIRFRTSSRYGFVDTNSLVVPVCGSQNCILVETCAWTFNRQDREIWASCINNLLDSDNMIIPSFLDTIPPTSFGPYREITVSGTNTALEDQGINLPSFPAVP